MKTFPKIKSAEYTDLNRVIGWYIKLRWIACIGVFITLLYVNRLLTYNLPYEILYILNGLIVFVNFALSIYYSIFRNKNLNRKEMILFFNIQIACDYILLFFIIYFTGFVNNPFIYYFVFHIMLTSFIFSSKTVTIYVASLVSALVGVSLGEYFNIIPHYPFLMESLAQYRNILFIRLLALCSTLIISAYLILKIKEKIEEKGKQVEVELNKYKNLDKIKSNFILQVTHELRGPVAALKGFHDMLLRGVVKTSDRKVIEVLKKANRRTENLLTMIDEMLDYAYMKTGEEIKLKLQDLSLKNIIDENIETFQSFADDKNIKLVSNCNRGIKIKSNRDLLNIILNNLISNAIKYSPPHTSVTINAEEENNHVHLLVKDEGIGIEPNELDKIFEEFYRTRKAMEIEKDGTGLGLPIVKKATEALRGKITVYSEVNRGTTFHLYFPKK